MEDRDIAKALASKISKVLAVREASFEELGAKGPHSMGWYTKYTESAAREAGVEPELLGVVIALIDGDSLEVNRWSKAILSA